MAGGAVDWGSEVCVRTMESSSSQASAGSAENISRSGPLELQIPPLPYPGFPVEVGGVGALMRPFTEGRTCSHVQCSVAGNPGTVQLG